MYRVLSAPLEALLVEVILPGLAALVVVAGVGGWALRRLVEGR
jgi:hypothetical protein